MILKDLIQVLLCDKRFDLVEQSTDAILDTVTVEELEYLPASLLKRNVVLIDVDDAVMKLGDDFTESPTIRKIQPIELNLDDDDENVIEKKDNVD